MKFFIVFALCVAAATARFVVPDVVAAEAAEIKEILAAINHPSTDPATAASLLQLLNDVLGVSDSPVVIGPAIVDEAPIAGPVIVDQNEESPIAVGPVIIDENDLIDVGPAIVDPPAASSSPLVQIIINVKSGASVAEKPVVIEGPKPTPVIVVDTSEEVEGPKPSPVIVVDTPEEVEGPKPTPVIVVDTPEEVEGPKPSPVIVVDTPENTDDVEIPIINNPVFPTPVVAPDTLN